MDNGSLIVVYRQGTNHATTQDGNLRKRTSSDNGASWSSATTILDDASLDLRDPCVSVLSSGRVIVSYSTWNGTENDGGRVPKIIYSDDNGGTWSSPVTITNSFTYWAISCAPVVELANGDLLAPLYGLDDGDSDSYRTARVSRSTDDGATWAHLAEIADGPSVSKNWGEPNIVLLDNGDLLCMLRCDASGSASNEIHASTSTDDGATWSTPQGKLGGSGRPAVAQRSDGLVVCMYRAPNTDRCRYRVSNNRGYSWTQADADFTGGSTLAYEYGQWVTLGSGQLAAVYALETSSTDADLSFSKITGGS